MEHRRQTDLSLSLSLSLSLYRVFDNEHAFMLLHVLVCLYRLCISQDEMLFVGLLAFLLIPVCYHCHIGLTGLNIGSELE